MNKAQLLTYLKLSGLKLGLLLNFNVALMKDGTGAFSACPVAPADGTGAVSIVGKEGKDDCLDEILRNLDDKHYISTSLPKSSALL